MKKRMNIISIGNKYWRDIEIEILTCVFINIERLIIEAEDLFNTSEIRVHHHQIPVAIIPNIV